MVRLSKIYTKNGDAGQTMLGSGETVVKHDLRVAAYGDVDEANATVGLAAVVIGESPDIQPIGAILRRVQNDLFDVGADLCVPLGKNDSALRVTAAQVSGLENAIDELNDRLNPLNSFVLPGGSELAARLHVARCAVRRAERSVSALVEQASGAVNVQSLIYMNRLSDLLFVMARVANNDGKGDVLWVPGQGRE